MRPATAASGCSRRNAFTFTSSANSEEQDTQSSAFVSIYCVSMYGFPPNCPDTLTDLGVRERCSHRHQLLVGRLL